MANVDPETGIWNLTIAKKRHKTDYFLAAGIWVRFQPQSVVDVGCGPGHYCKIMAAYGAHCVLGLEGTKGIRSIKGSYGDILEVDLTKPFSLEMKFDLVLCLEVGEHIPPQHEKIFLDNLCALGNKDLILSWAAPGQYSASGHVNCQPIGYIARRMFERGWHYQDGMSSYLRSCAGFSWFRNNVMVFKR